MQKIDYADAPMEKVKISKPLGQAAFTFLSEIAKAKEEGKQLPKALDKIATLTLEGKNAAISTATDTAKKELSFRMGWIIAVVVGIVLVFVLLKK